MFCVLRQCQGRGDHRSQGGFYSDANYPSGSWIPSWCLLTIYSLIKAHVPEVFLYIFSTAAARDKMVVLQIRTRGIACPPGRAACGHCVGRGLQSKSFVLRPKAHVETISHTCCWLSCSHLSPSNKASHFHQQRSPVSYRGRSWLCYFQLQKIIARKAQGSSFSQFRLC